MSDQKTVTELTALVEKMNRRIDDLEATNAVRHLHYKYGYYIDKCLYDEACELFSEDSEVYFLGGIYKGKAGVRRLYCDWFRNYFTGGFNGPVHGFLLDHFQSQGVIDILPDGKTAKGRFRAILMGGTHHSVEKMPEGLPRQFWEGGVYENTYVKEGGEWKIRTLDYNMTWQSTYEEGWANSDPHLVVAQKTYPEDPLGPDVLLPERAQTIWPHTKVVPFHYPSPVKS